MTKTATHTTMLLAGALLAATLPLHAAHGRDAAAERVAGTAMPASAAASGSATAASGAKAAAGAVHYTLDPSHTFPSVEVDHGGWSFWRGKFRKSSGTLVMDRAAGTGTFEATIDLASIDMGHDELNTHLKGDGFFDVGRYPTATWKGRLTGFRNGVPARAEGELTLHGVTRPLTLRIDRFKCAISPMVKREVCGVNLTGSFDRATYGLDLGRDKGFAMLTKLSVQAEAIRD